MKKPVDKPTAFIMRVVLMTAVLAVGAVNAAYFLAANVVFEATDSPPAPTPPAPPLGTHEQVSQPVAPTKPVENETTAAAQVTHDVPPPQ